jgi:hypothetical protein
MRKWRLTKAGQLRPLSDEELHHAVSQDERWTVRPALVIVIAILLAGIFVLTLTHKFQVTEGRSLRIRHLPDAHIPTAVPDVADVAVS